jgi:DNA mismatch repair protein MutS
MPDAGIMPSAYNPPGSLKQKIRRKPPDNVAASPMLEQYRRIKKEHRDNVLFFRLGDFYEMFQEDALEVSALLNLALTSRNGLPMCGVPYHAARSYIARLLKYGKKVAICEQLTAPGKGLIERKVVEIITPGTTIDEYYLEQGSSNYLASLSASAAFISFAYIDLSTGEFFATSFPLGKAAECLAPELERLNIREMIVSESLIETNPVLARQLAGRTGMLINRWADWLFDLDRGNERLKRQFGMASLKAFGLDDASPEILSAGALLEYLDDTAKGLLLHVRAIKVYGGDEFVGIDEATQRNLELARNLRDGSEHFTLLEILDETKTSMGRRLLKRRLFHPLRSEELITRRLDLVESFYHDQETLQALREVLSRTPDLERLCSRLAMDKAHGKDMIAVRNALAAISRIEESCFRLGAMPRFESSDAAAFDETDLAVLEELRELLEKGLCENPSILLTEGCLIRDGFDGELDRLKTLKDSGRKLLEDYLETERAATGIPSLKIRYNKLIGYFFEVTKTYLSRVPSYFIRRQGMAGGERFSTEQLAQLESDINGAQDRIIEREKELFLAIREKAKAELFRLSAAGKRAAELDAAQSLAWAATRRGWVRPRLDEKKRLVVVEGRHPVVEANLPSGEFIPNDINLDCDGTAFALITGPNMAGKSTYLRQTALIVIMAQMGSFVPAREAAAGIVDRIYCRVGASDNLARGESTFLVEMNETAYILRTATDRSLVIMDEVGRGTGTGDGLAIAWAVCEELLDHAGARTLFATHYHELSMLSHPRLVNRSMEVLEKNGEILFLRKLREGAAAESYGLHVASLAGLPETVLERARALLERIRAAENAIRDALPAVSDGKTPSGAGDISAKNEAKPPPASQAAVLLEALVQELASIDINNLTPLDALNYLQKLKTRAMSGSVLSFSTSHGEKQWKIKRNVPGSLPLFDGL